MNSYLNTPEDETPKHAQAGLSSAAIIGIVALVIIVIALLLMNDRTDGVETNMATTSAEEVGREIDEAAATAEENTELAAARLEAKTRIAAIQAQYEIDKNAEKAAAEIEAVEADLAAVYADAQGEAKEAWTELKTDFDELEAGLRDGTGDVLAAFKNVFARFEADVRVDNE